jgi:hypothetical protein
LEDENHRLRKLVADLSLEKEVLKAVIEKTGGARRAPGASVLAVGQFLVSQRRIWEPQLAPLSGEEAMPSGDSSVA